MLCPRAVSRGRTAATERYTGATVSLTQDSNLTYSPQPVVVSLGTLESASETLYDSAGRIWRTISGRVPMSTLSGIALSQAQALSNYPTHGTGSDPYAGQNLSPGVISDTLFDARGRGYATLGQPLLAADVGLSGTNFDNKLVRPRTETVFDALGRASLQRSGLAQVESSTGKFQGVYDVDSVDSKTYTDALGNAYRSELMTGGTIAYDTQTQSTTRTGGSVYSYTLTRFDTKNRPVAQMAAVLGSVTAVWSESVGSFVVDGTSTTIPTKLSIYDSADRLVAVELPAVANPQNSGAMERPRYEYAYDSQGSQTLIRDPLGHETRFTFTDRGQEATRTLPLGFGTDGVPSAADLASLQSNPASLPFTERFTYDSLGRQVLHYSFEGVVTENIYDNFGRLSYINYYADQAALDTGTISERWSYQYDSYGRKSAAIHSVNNSGTFTQDRVEETHYDDRGRVIAESSPEGVLGYTYDPQDRMTSTKVFAAGADPETDAPARVTSYGYDTLGRLVSVTEDSTPTSTSDEPQLRADYTFDLDGRMDTTTISDPSTSRSVTTDYDYDALGRLDTQTDTDQLGNVVAFYDYTVRADGQRTALEETHWFDANSDGVVDSGEQKTTTYDWSYDSIGRLTDEVIDHWDDSLDQTESFTYGLAGNRAQLDRDHGNDGIDQTIAYEYDANDRLLEEVLDDLVNNSNDSTTTYGYDRTQQTSKTVTVGVQTVSGQIFSYNLQGRMSSVTNESYTNGTLSARGRTGYSYDANSYRVAIVNEVDSALDGNYTLTSSTEFSADAHNHTGYTQTIRETTVNADGSTRTVDFTFGHDEIDQRTVERGSSGNITSDQTLVFGHDGHGSVRVLDDLAETTASVLKQVLTFSAYGQMLGVFSSAAVLVGTTQAATLTSLGYSGELWDAASQQQYLRARFYDTVNGSFNRLDPYAGNALDPRTFHKYAYTQNNPVGMIDPSGLSGVPGYVYQAVGTKVHHMLTIFAFAWGWTDYRYAPGATLHTILPAHFPTNTGNGALKPDITSVSTREYFEMKPVTNARDAGKLSELQVQMGSYDSALQPLDFKRGESSAVTLGLRRMVLGVVSYLRDKYLVELLPAQEILFDGSDGRGVLWYELTKLDKKREKQYEDQPSVEIPNQLDIPLEVQREIRVMDYKFGEPGLQHDNVTTGLGIAALVAFRLAVLAYTSSAAAAAATVTTNAIAGSIGMGTTVATTNTMMSGAA